MKNARKGRYNCTIYYNIIVKWVQIMYNAVQPWVQSVYSLQYKNVQITVQKCADYLYTRLYQADQTSLQQLRTVFLIVVSDLPVFRFVKP